jgi:hypothetical protein
MNHYSLQVMARDRIAQQRREAAQHNLARSRRSRGVPMWRTWESGAGSGAVVGRLLRFVARLASWAQQPAPVSGRPIEPR